MEEKTRKTKTSAAQIRASAKYTREKCDRLSVTLPKGHRPTWEQAAAAEGVSLSRWTIKTLDAAAAQGLRDRPAPPEDQDQDNGRPQEPPKTASP